MADDQYLTTVKDFLRDPGASPPKALLLGGGGNDVINSDPLADPPKLPPLLKLLAASSQTVPLIETELKQFIDVELAGYLETILAAVRSVTAIPILIHAYDHPIPDGRPLKHNGQVLSGPWMQPVFTQRGYNIPEFPNVSADLNRARDVMRLLIDRLNQMVHQFVDPNKKIFHVNLTGTLAASYGAPENYATLWDNELHANEDGFDVLAAMVAAQLRQLSIG
jgi:lysophospholipase L1-like esterase